MDAAAQAKLQVRLVIATYRRELRRGTSIDLNGFRDRALAILADVEQRLGSEPAVARLVADARRELDADVREARSGERDAAGAAGSPMTHREQR